MRTKALKLFSKPDITLLTVFQIIQEIPFEHEKGYFKKDKLNFNKVYFDLLKALIKKLQLEEYKKIKIIVDSRKAKGSVLIHKSLRKEIQYFLDENYKQTLTEFKTQSSSTDILIEFADFISNTFYRAYQNEDDKFFTKLDFKLIQIKNPL